MISFIVLNRGKLLDKWPDEVKGRAFCIYLADADNRPVEKSFDFEYGHLICYCPDFVSRKLFVRYHVEGFGEPVLRTRLLQSGKRVYNLSLELAMGRMELIDAQLGMALIDGIQISHRLTESIDTARSLALESAVLDQDESSRAKAAVFADRSLAISVPAGEDLALEIAKWKITHHDKTGVLFGCNYFKAGNDHLGLFSQAFNFATLPFYLKGMEPEPGRVSHKPVFDVAHELKRHNIALKGHPLVWTFSEHLPDHRLGMDYTTCLNVFRDRILRDVPPFNGLIEYWDVINEAHTVPWTNPSGYTLNQFIDLSGMAAETCRRAAPEAKTVINVCLPFGEYAAGCPGRMTPLEYIRACIGSGIDFDVIGVQFYYGSGLMQYSWDMLEISGILDEFCSFGKEVHITELGTPSAMRPDPNAVIKQGNEVGLWHNEWNEQTQADWVEQFYTICLSKPEIKGITWWDFQDKKGIFWPHGGLIHENGKPKESYARLLAVKSRIGQQA